jgi:radical SAM protein with 4Fe4S-binding SPASM domain
VLAPSPYAHRYDLDDGGCAVLHALSLDVAWLGPALRSLFTPVWSRPLPFPAPPGGVGDHPPAYPAPAEPVDPARWLAEGPAAERAERRRALEALRALGMLREEGDDGDARQLSRLRAMVRDNPAKMLMLVPTRRCNLRCTYCHQHDDSRGRGADMGVPLADAFLDAWAALARGSPGRKDLLLYGGEPLLNGPVVRHVIARVAAAPEGAFGGRVSVVLVTNATRITPAWAEFFAAHDTFVIVSCDGPRRVNDLARIGPTGRGSFERAARGVERLRRAGVRVAVSVTVGRHNVATLAGDFLDLIDRFEPLDIGLNSCLHPPWGARQNAEACPPLEATRRMLAAYAGARARGVYVEQMNRRIRPFALRLQRVKDCSSCGGRVVAQADGRWAFCDSFSFTEEHCWPFEGTFDLASHPEYPRWCALSPVLWPGCQACPALALCGGGCRYDAAMASGQLDGLDPCRCTQDREILRWILHDLARIAGGDHLGPLEVRVPSEAARRQLLGELSLDPLSVPLGNANRYGEEVGR